jgi:hypothetical protein
MVKKLEISLASPSRIVVSSSVLMESCLPSFDLPCFQLTIVKEDGHFWLQWQQGDQLSLA